MLKNSETKCHLNNNNNPLEKSTSFLMQFAQNIPGWYSNDGNYFLAKITQSHKKSKIWINKIC